MNLPVLFRTRWVSQTCRTHKALTLRRRGYAVSAVHVSLSSVRILSCPHAVATFGRCAPDGAARYFAGWQKPEVADGLSACMGGLLDVEQGGNTGC
jgi:hypothetical protein